MKRPEFEVIGDQYRFHWADVEITAQLVRLEDRRGDLSGEITLKSYRPEYEGLLHQAKFNLSSTTARKTLAKALQERVEAVDWMSLLEQVCFLSLERYRKGEPLIDLREVQVQERARWLLEPFLDYGGPTVLYADGGTGKSMFGLAVAVSVASGERLVTDKGPDRPQPVWYMDWEASKYDHAERLKAIYRGWTIDPEQTHPIYYTRETSSLHERAGEARTQIADLRIGLVVVDSAAAARGGEPESAEVTLRMFNACRMLNCPVLIIDHITKSQEGKQDKPFGSVYTHNMSRLMWKMERGNHSEEPGELDTILLTNTKANNGPLKGRLAFKIHFDMDPADASRLLLVGYQRTDHRGEESLIGSLSHRDKIAIVLRDGDRKTAEICADLWERGVKVANDTVKSTLFKEQSRRRGEPLWKRVSGMGKDSVWSLNRGAV